MLRWRLPLPIMPGEGRGPLLTSLRRVICNPQGSGMNSQYEHLGLARWPFPVVPEREFCTFIADRRQLRADAVEMLTHLSRRSTSSIHLFWAWFGAGKTHTLYYLANRAAVVTKDPGGNVLHTVYSEFPKAARSFLDLYRTFAVGLDMEVLIDAFLEIATSGAGKRLQQQMMMASPDLATALKVIATGEAQDQVTAMRWLKAESLPVSEFRRVGIVQKINSSEEAVRILAALVEMLTTAARSDGRPAARLIWFLDEFQRIERTGAWTRDEVNTGLHSTFNACPNGLSLCLSFSGKPLHNSLPGWFSPELRDRIGRTKVMVLPPMSPKDALGFVKDLLAEFRTKGSGHPPFFPFTEESCKVILEEVSQKDELKPRSIMHAFNAVLQEADRSIESGKMEFVTPEFAKRVLKEYIVLADAEES